VAPPDGAKPDAAKKAAAPTPPGDGSQVTVPQGGGGTTIIVNTAPAPTPAPTPAPAPPPPPPPVRRAPPPPPPKPLVVPPRYEPSPPVAPRYRTEWGFNTHIEGAMMGSKNRAGRSDEAGMGGLGFALRVRPTRHFALDLGLDFVSGKDYQGYTRSEVPFTVNAVLFANPRDKTQLYFLAGLGWSTAHVAMPNDTTTQYNYFGLQTGVGVEFRVARHVGLNIDAIGFVRGRTDDKAATNPEFVDPTTGKQTNTSGGGLLRGGLTVYWLAASGGGSRVTGVRGEPPAFRGRVTRRRAPRGPRRGRRAGRVRRRRSARRCGSGGGPARGSTRPRWPGARAGPRGWGRRSRG
jgi:hypothetical protein